MTGALKITIFTKDKLVVESSIQLYNENLYGTVAIDEVPSCVRGDLPSHIFNVEDNNDPVFLKIADLVLKRAKEDAIYFRAELKKIGIDVIDADKNPVISGA